MDPGVNRCLNTMGETAMRRMLACAFALLAPLAANAACPDDAAVARLAAALTSGQPAEPFPGLSMADADCARDKLVPLLAPAFGAPVGYKVGLPPPAVQQRFGLTGPVWGVIFDQHDRGEKRRRRRPDAGDRRHRRRGGPAGAGAAMTGSTPPGATMSRSCATSTR